MVASNMNSPAPVTPAYLARRCGRAVVEMPTVETIDRAYNWQADQVRKWRKVAGNASERARRFHRAMDRADSKRRRLLGKIAVSITTLAVQAGIANLIASTEVGQLGRLVNR